MDTKIDIDELGRLAKAATSGPWEVGEFAGIHNGFEGVAMAYAGNLKMNENAAYITAACNAVPEIICMYRKAKDEANDADTAYQMVDRDNVDLTRHILELRAKVAELERQRDWLADALQNMCAWNQDNESCYIQNVCPAGKLCVCAEVITKYDWIEAAEKAAKEAGV